MSTVKPVISATDGNVIFQTYFIPVQKPPPAPDAPSMLAHISTFPALGQVTQIQKYTTALTALLEVDQSRASDPWQLSLWHSVGKEWQEVPMDPVIRAETRPSELQAEKAAAGQTRLYFTTPLAIHLPTTFTIKFRASPSQPWKWVKDHQGTPDGVVMLSSVTSQEAISSELGDYITGLNPILKSENHRSQTPGTTVWSVEAPIEAADGGESAIKDVKFGLPWGGKFSRCAPQLEHLMRS